MSPDPAPSGFSWSQLTPREQRFVKRSLLLAVVLPIALVVFLPDVAVLDAVEWIVFVFLLPLYVVMRLVFRWLHSGESFPSTVAHDLRWGYPGCPVGKNVRHATWPLVTTSIILVNCLVFLAGAAPELMAFHGDRPGDWYWSNLSSMFAHSDMEHLFFNMLFLWIFGSALEGRVGWRRYFLLYVLAGTGSNVVSVAAWWAMGVEDSYAVGASGAITGIMGLFMVRCYFSRVSLGVPILGIAGTVLPVSLRVQVNAVVLVTLFFVKDLLGARESLIYETTVDYWGHLGGYLTGLALAYRLGLFRDGIREHTIARVASPESVVGHGKSRTELDSLLQTEPDNVEARLARARREARFGPTAEGQADYLDVVRTLLPEDGPRAASTFVECFRASPCSLPIAEQLALTPALSRLGERRIAAFALDHAAARDPGDPSLVAKALLYEARLHRELGNADLAARVHEQILRKFPGSEAAALVRERR